MSDIPVTRVERDSLGEFEVPAGAYWGIHTGRALENFPISGRPLCSLHDLVRAYGYVKLAAALANVELGLIESWRGEIITTACHEVIDGTLSDQFVVDVIQGGAGTSTNMNLNEVIANRAIEVAGHPLGSYDIVSPLDHVNRCQSTNDTYPTAARLALQSSLDRVVDEARNLSQSLASKGLAYRDVLKVGRTQLQDAVPMTVGQEFGAWATTLGDATNRLHDVRSALLAVPLGGTAIGTGITAHRDYAKRACGHLAQVTGLPISAAPHLISATSSMGIFVEVSGALKALAIALSKICNDLRLLSSGPQAGLGELLLPPRQAGSSIMPGKVNPVIPEVANQVCFHAIGADVAVTMAAEAGQLQLNAFGPLIVHHLLETSQWLENAISTLARNCIDGIRVDTAHVGRLASESAGTATVLTPFIGYTAAGEIAKSALAGGGPVRELAERGGLLTTEQLDEIFKPESLTTPSQQS